MRSHASSSLPRRIRWTTRTNLVTGSCVITSASVRLKSTVALPRWKAPHLVQPALVAWWKPVIKHFAWHEAQHIKIARSYNSKLKSQLVGHKCSAAKEIIRKWERSLTKAQAKFDRKDLSWQPYVVPYTGPGGYFGDSIT